MTTSNQVATHVAATKGGGLFGCTLGALDLIGFVFVVTHIGPIWAALSRLVH